VVGEWRETPQGYAVEIRIPLYFVSQAIAVIVHDRDAGSDRSVKVSSSGTVEDVIPNDLLRTSAQLQQMIERIGLREGRRVWVINRSGQVLASGGTLASETKRGAINLLYTWILPAASGTFEDDLKSASRLRGDEVLRALGGASSTRWRSSRDERAVIVSAAHPVRAGNELIGAVVVEETTNSIQTLQRDAMAALFNQSIFVFVGVSLILLIFASRLSFRIGKLRDQAERAIDPHGRVVGVFASSSASDEIGDLSRSYSTMLERLADYNAYLESMASKLSHELRTPLAVVSSSLENLDALDLDEDQERYLERARDGMDRLHNLVSRLSEASRLEQSVSSVDFEEFDLAKLLNGCVDGYRAAYPTHRIELTGTLEPCGIVGSGDLIMQLLDKLIDNAVAFSLAADPIEIALSTRTDMVELCVTNRGSSLPEAMQKQIFNSMVSLRQERSGTEPHLGLGLFIARLIVELHHGQISAHNLDDGSGVRFAILLPRSGPPPVRP
jgi:dedicated sortase system histidine kinase